MTVLDAVRKRLDVVMRERNYSLYKLNKEGGIALSTLSQIINGKQSRISLDIIYQITSTMGVSLTEFFKDAIFDEITD